MTCAIAYKNNEGVFTVGVDTCVTGGDYVSTHQLDVKYEVFYDKKGENPGLIVFSGGVGLFQRIINGLNSKDYDRLLNLDKKMTTQTLSGFINKIRDIGIDVQIDGSFEMLIIHDKECFYIDSNLAVLQINDYFAIGNGMPTAMGAIAMADNKNRKQKVIENRILKALRITTKQQLKVRPPYVILKYDENKLIRLVYDK